MVWGVLPVNGLHREAASKRGTFIRLKAYKRVGVARAEVSGWKRITKSDIGI